MKRTHAIAFIAVVLLACLAVPCLAAQVQIPERAVQYRASLTRAAHYYWGLDAPVAAFAAQIHTESRFKTDAVSPAGARGIAQFSGIHARDGAAAGLDFADGLGQIYGLHDGDGLARCPGRQVALSPFLLLRLSQRHPRQQNLPAPRLLPHRHKAHPELRAQTGFVDADGSAFPPDYAQGFPKIQSGGIAEAICAGPGQIPGFLHDPLGSHGILLCLITV